VHCATLIVLRSSMKIDLSERTERLFSAYARKQMR
jgi:hypothetical protein